MKNTLVGAGLVTAIAIAATGCSGGASSSASSSASASRATSSSAAPAPTSASPTSSPSAQTVILGDQKLILIDASSVPSGWPAGIPAPKNGTVSASGTAEPTNTVADHAMIAVKYSDELDEPAAAKSQLNSALTSKGWKQTASNKAYTMYSKGNETLHVAVVANPVTVGSDIYLWL